LGFWVFFEGKKKSFFVQLSKGDHLLNWKGGRGQPVPEAFADGELKKKGSFQKGDFVVCEKGDGLAELRIL